jgi:phosphoribosylaminoimidazole-succinocarboxamide synthase
MHRSDPLFESAIPALPLLGRGKVRDIYGVDDGHLLIVTTDRLSAYDVVLPDPVPGKGRILTGISNFWFRMMADIVPNHLSQRTVESVVEDASLHHMLAGRSIVVKRLRPLPIEAVVRGYLIGSGWRDYQASRSLCGIPLPAGLEQAGRLPETLFTPATKLLSFYAQGKIRPTISQSFPLARAGEAIDWLAGRKALGKVVVTME